MEFRQDTRSLYPHHQLESDFLWPIVPIVHRNEPLVCPNICHKLPIVGYARDRGFTLVELIITVVIAGILAATAVPAFTNFVRNQRLVGQVNDFVGDLMYARSEAIKRGNNIVICTGKTTCDSSLNWADGHIIFSDNDNGNDLDSNESIVRARSGLEGGNTLNATTSGGKIIVFNSRGAAASGAGTYSLCDSRLNSERRNVIVNSVGQVRAEKSVGSCT